RALRLDARQPDPHLRCRRSSDGPGPEGRPAELDREPPALGLSPLLRAAGGRAPHSGRRGNLASTTDEIPPRDEKVPRTLIFFGRHAATQSSRIRLTAFS